VGDGGEPVPDRLDLIQEPLGVVEPAAALGGLRSAQTVVLGQPQPHFYVVPVDLAPYSGGLAVGYSGRVAVADGVDLVKDAGVMLIAEQLVIVDGWSGRPCRCGDRVWPAAWNR